MNAFMDSYALRRCGRCGAVFYPERGEICDRCLAKSLLSFDAEPGRAPELVLRKLGDFELLEKIGRGGTGIVYRARQVSLGREVAVKVLREDRMAETEAITRLSAE